ncbi:N-methyl-D-aspartate receptor NMDAR2C subunit [Variovorax sp. J22R133]|uniref:HD domain-containing protein n=1 Tax=Variovorax brevis TaxID=3053503 RepID=UPI002578B6E9|nr:N-methyl-D-aspartate receptor NMDAR2C subunit [Variovorax sp. J22R133]MDM0113034.1 N-methyl-D-aspartate receptor NMDAR2C subunit [Variovorax sp. J22R133]
MREPLQSSWQEAWADIGVAVPDEALFNELVARYSEPQRHYHTLQHLRECLDGFERERASAERPGEVALALWFHDAIYDLNAHDNEARSADWARSALLAAGAAADVAERVHSLVMATRHDVQPVDADARLLVDIDLSILGAPAERFAEYEQQIRREYAHVPQDTFEARRRQILASFLARDPLYQTPGVRARCEASARANLRHAIG